MLSCDHWHALASQRRHPVGEGFTFLGSFLACCASQAILAGSGAGDCKVQRYSAAYRATAVGTVLVVQRVCMAHAMHTLGTVLVNHWHYISRQWEPYLWVLSLY